MLSEICNPQTSIGNHFDKTYKNSAWAANFGLQMVNGWLKSESADIS